MTNPGASDINGLLGKFKDLFFDKAIVNLQPVVTSLFVSLAVIDIVMAMIMNLGDPDTLKKTCVKILKYGGVLWIINEFKTIVYDWGLMGFAKIAGKAIGNAGGKYSPEQIMNDPSLIWDKGMELVDALFDSMSIWHLGMAFFKLFIGLIIAVCFIIITVQLFVTMLEFYVCAGISIIFIPFGVNQYTAFMAEKVKNALIGFGIKVMFLLFVLSAAMTECADRWILKDNSSKSTILAVFGEVACITFLSMKIPQIAAGFMSGAPSQNQNGMGVIGAARGALGKAAGAAGGMFQAARAGAAAASAGGGKGGTYAAASPKSGGSGGGKSGAATGAAMGDGGGGGSSSSTTTPSSLAPHANGANGGKDGAANVGATGDGGGGGSSSSTTTPSSLAPHANGANGGKDGAANVGATGDGGGGGSSSSTTTPNSLAPPQGSGKATHRPYITYDGKALAPPQGGVKGAEAIEAGAKVDEARKGKFGGALKGIARYALMSTPIGKGMSDAEEKMRVADRMKMRLKPSSNESTPQDKDNK
jgi:type IV secretion system protein TrbL